jgi:hypothetical protein
MTLNDSGFVRRIAAAALAVGGFCAAPVPALACVDGAPKGEVVTIQREVGATEAGQQADFHVLGGGWFRATEIVKQGGASDDTAVIVELDGQEVFASSFASLKKPWMQLNTSFIVAKVEGEGDTSTMTIWYSPELKFRAILAVRVEVREEGVRGMHMRAVMNKPGPHEDPPGGAVTAVALPAFK